MCSNWAFRSGWDVPSRVLRLACKLYPACLNSRATVMWLTGLSGRLNSAANLRVLLQVQRSGEQGSPRVAGSTNASKAFCNCGIRSVNRFRPLPGRRIRRGPVSTAADCNSRTPGESCCETGRLQRQPHLPRPNPTTTLRWQPTGVVLFRPIPAQGPETSRESIQQFVYPAYCLFDNYAAVAQDQLVKLFCYDA